MFIPLIIVFSINDTLEISRQWGYLWVILGIITFIPVLYFNILWIIIFFDYFRFEKNNLSNSPLEEEIKIEPKEIKDKMFLGKELLVSFKDNVNENYISTFNFIFKINKNQEKFNFYFYLLLFSGDNHILLNGNSLNLEEIINYWNNRDDIFKDLTK
ncbi:hypothetical protein [Mycoplasma sp. OR1901]|uniref:hypothetical protein n=1 Tax=Mycoplasma sp. OR1901 TaxID=2742195 RepID=UPI001584275A|nr:hypothetical protein [Mycoplasma sp. OR1901]QKT05712.1 hypothetical protein HTZ87_03355 [Mycoplasma sp. OR1901]